MMAKALPAGPTGARAWWREAVFYQVYPRSFADANGDGIGDLAGLTERLDYLVDLGIDAVWLSPHYPSPLRDLGYDISDFRGVDPAYGTIDDIVRLLEGAHRRGIRVVLDLVLNHTSDQHPWFVESRASAKSPRRDWYLWRPGRGAGPPNNWVSQFGGPAWQRDEATGEYFYHCFLPEQPDGRRRSALRDVHRAHRHLQPGTGVALTGRYPHGHGMLNNTHESDALRTELPADIPTLPMLPRARGYRLGHVGKWHVGPDGVARWPVQQGTGHVMTRTNDPLALWASRLP